MGETERIAQLLAPYLGSALERLRLLAEGWETIIFEFATRSASVRLPSSAARRLLILRFYRGGGAVLKAAREFSVIERLKSARFAVPAPYLVETDPAPLGAPFMVMERLQGGPLFRTDNFPLAFKTFSLAFLAFVRAQARLHRLAPEAIAQGPGCGFVVSPRLPASMPLIERALATLAERIESGALSGMREALAALSERAPKFRAAAAVPVHLDYHPRNVIVRGLSVTGVIDWCNADLGDRHFDAAMSSVILSTSVFDEPRWMRDNVAGNSLRRLFTALYLPLYHALAGLELERLRFYQGLAAMLRLSMLATMRLGGSEGLGFRAQAVDEVSPSLLRVLARYARKKTGAPLTLPAMPAG